MLANLLQFVRRPYRVGKTYNFRYHGKHRTVHVEELKTGKRGQPQIFGQELVNGVFVPKCFNIGEIE